MIRQLNITLPDTIVQFISQENYSIDFKGKLELNSPTGDFFYDQWNIKPEYKGTHWEKILDSLDCPIGQARIISLQGEKCYTKHADIDDRYHLNLAGDEGYLIDFDIGTMYKTVKDFKWYEMDAGRIHSAASFGRHIRIQLVVRKLLVRNKLKNPIKATVELLDWDSRYMFDNTLSKWLNVANKNGTITNFLVGKTTATFELEKSKLEELNQLVPKEVIVSFNSI
jgi:hypothetical protein